jgi:hypothetical protein
MSMQILSKVVGLPLVVAGLVVGTSGLTGDIVAAQPLKEQERALQERIKELERREQELLQRTRALEDKTVGREDVLPDAKPGQCFGKVLVPAQYKTVTEQVLVRETSEKIEIIPTKYQTAEDVVLIKEAHEKIEEVPAVYETVKEKLVVEPGRLVWRRGRGSKAKLAPTRWVSEAVAAGVRADPEVGVCFAEFHQSVGYKTVAEKVLKKEAGTRVEIVPAKYEWVEETVLVKEASEKLVEVPAVYDTVDEQLMEAPAYATWKKGRGLIERVDNLTGDIMCLVEIPAKYRTVTKRVLKSPAEIQKVTIPAEYDTVRVQRLVAPAQVKTIEIPAEYQTIEKVVKVSDEVIGWRLEGSEGVGKATGRVICRSEIEPKYKMIKKQVLKTPATTAKAAVPAEYETIEVQKVATPSQIEKLEVPAKYQSVVKRMKVSEEKLAWRSVLCETNTSPNLVSDIQRALKKEGHDPGPIDGRLGRQTHLAIDAFQRAKGLETGGLTIRTLAALGVKVGPQ